MTEKEKTGKAATIPTAFDSSEMEPKIYELWEKSGYFSPDKIKELYGEEAGEPFTISLPPPNANDDLHIGHMCGYSFQDALGRFHRMNGRPTLLLPGKDHAGIQTEAVFTKQLEQEGKDKWKMGREKFYEECYKFTQKNAKSAQKQEKRIGLSADWDREFFTLDPRLTEVIYDTFYKLIEDGLVYRGKRIINQCPHCKTALADIDTIHKETRGIFAYIVYPFVDEKDKKLAKKKLGTPGITIATTRPETMLGDVAVAVNPKDKRFKKFIGKKVLLPIAEREIPVIADEAVDMETGGGALKVTPAHSPIDYEIGQRHDLEIINVIDEEGKMTGPIPDRFKGMGATECSKALVKELEEQGLLQDIENIKHEVAVCERCKTAIEPIISNQWFLNAEPLAQKALEAIKNKETNVIPIGQQRALEHFFRNIQPWCISRQLWWGQRIPIWYSGSRKLYDWLNDNPGKTVDDFEIETGEKSKGSGKMFLGIEKPKEDPDWNGQPEWEQEEDVFDTWFSSGQWPFSTLGGIEGEDFKKYYPTSVMETARDILFWWVARMMMLSIYRTGKTPFHTVFLHGLILAEDGQKMSKSKGNGVEPSLIFEKYGADALRLWYFIDSLPGSNAPLREEKIKGNRNFVNKIWNASRFIMMNIEGSEVGDLNNEMKSIAEKFKTDKLEQGSRLYNTFHHMRKIKQYCEKYKFNLGAEKIRGFFWHTFCDNWIEDVKKATQGEPSGSEKRIAEFGELIFILKENLKAMHPFIPFITEAVWQELKEMGLADGMLMIERW